jgi:hypothetical protein
MRIAIIAISVGAMTSAAAAAPEHQAAVAVAPPIKAVATAKAGVPNFDAMIGIFDKMFPPLPDPDPARLALARTAVVSMWPDGAYGKMMRGFLGGTIDRAMQLKTSDLMGMAGAPAKTDASAPANDQSFHDKAAAKDPFFDQRMTAYRQVLEEETAKMSTVIDPRMRDGLARSMARKFDARQLADIDAFFATPSGHALASQYMQLWVEPDTLRSMFTAVPEMMKLMPDATRKMKAIDAKFPKPPKADKPDKTAAKP